MENKTELRLTSLKAANVIKLTTSHLQYMTNKKGVAWFLKLSKKKL